LDFVHRVTDCVFFFRQEAPNLFGFLRSGYSQPLGPLVSIHLQNNGCSPRKEDFFSMRLQPIFRVKTYAGHFELLHYLLHI